ncbi:glyoxylase-like metal-dependent hydrolase (beta-lactamase superfamily II) [Bradyrhizobium sp. USDA 3315]
MHAYLIRTRHHTILFDNCCGNDKERSYEPTWHRLQNPFLHRLARAGVLPEQVDFVMCSHLHADHVGWNTRLLNGQWVPTFPNARYLISKGEFDWWRDAIEAGSVKPYRKLSFDDSVLPVVDRGLATFVEDDYALENQMPDEVRFMPLHGHTKHHCGLYLCSRSQDAIFSGDAIHQPIQLARPDWVNAGYWTLSLHSKAQICWFMINALFRRVARTTGLTSGILRSSLARGDSVPILVSPI